MGRILGAYRELLRNRPLTRLLIGEWISSIGDWLYLVALLVLVYGVTQDPFLLGIIGAARVLPYVFLSVPAGVVVDRFDRRRLLLVTDVGRGSIMVVLALLVAFDGPLWLIVSLVIVGTCLATFFGPAIGAYLPTLVENEEQLGPANSAWATLDNLAFVVGPAIAGILIATSGLVLAFVLNAISFGIVAVVLAGLPSGRAPEAVPAPGDSADSVASDSARPASRVPLDREVLLPLAGLALIGVVGTFADGGLSVMTVVIAVSNLGGGEQATGFLNAGIGVGGVIGAIVAGILVLRPRLAPVLLLGSVTLAVGCIALGYAAVMPAAFAAIAVTAAGLLILEITSRTVLQRVAPDRVRGRVLGVLETVTTIAFAAGAFAVPVLADRLGSGPVMAAVGVAVAVCGVAGTVLAGSTTRRAPDPAADARLTLLAELPIFAGIPRAALAPAAARLVPIAVAAGEVVVRQGDPADRFYVIDEGSFDVTRVDVAPETGLASATFLRTMGPGEVFGEIGLLQRRPRTATVTAATTGRLLAIDEPTFLGLVSAVPFVGPRLLDLRRGAPGAAT
jgi:MFS family permease